MRIVEGAIRYPVRVAVGALLLVLFGGLALARIPVQLTPTEYELLRVLSVNAGRVVTHESLLRQAWRKGDQRPPDPKLVRAVVKRLRRKLGDDAANPAYIRNERGVGYSMPAGSR